MDFLKLLFTLSILPTWLTVIFPGGGLENADKGLINNYPYHILNSEKTLLNSLLLILFTKNKKDRRPFIFYTKIGYAVLAALQIPMAIIIYCLKLNIFALYFRILLIIIFIPNIVYLIMVCILDKKERAYKRKMGIKIETFWDVLKQDRGFRASEKRRKYEKTVRNAIEPYIEITNPKKRKETVFADDIEKVSEILKRDFPDTRTVLTADEKGNKVFYVYCRTGDRPIVSAFVKKRR